MFDVITDTANFLHGPASTDIFGMLMFMDIDSTSIMLNNITLFGKYNSRCDWSLVSVKLFKVFTGNFPVLLASFFGQS